MVRCASSAPPSTHSDWPLRSPSPAENRSIWIEFRGEQQNSNDGSALARGRLDPAGTGHDLGKLSRLLSTQFRFALPAGSRGDVHGRLPAGVLRPYLFWSSR